MDNEKKNLTQRRYHTAPRAFDRPCPDCNGVIHTVIHSRGNIETQHIAPSEKPNG